MRKYLFLIVLILVASVSYSQSEPFIDLHFGLGFELNIFGFGFTSANSVVFKHGDIGFGATGGVGWEMFDFFSDGFIMPFFWSFYTSYEYPKWFGAFFSFGSYDKGYTYKTILIDDKAKVSRYYYAFGLQKTLYFSHYQDRWIYTPGYYYGDPSLWRAGTWSSPGTKSFSMNFQLGLRYDLEARKIDYSTAFPPLDLPTLLSSINKDNNKIKFFISMKVNYDFPVEITKKKKEE